MEHGTALRFLSLVRYGIVESMSCKVQSLSYCGRVMSDVIQYTTVHPITVQYSLIISLDTFFYLLCMEQYLLKYTRPMSSGLQFAFLKQSSAHRFGLHHHQSNRACCAIKHRSIPTEIGRGPRKIVRNERDGRHAHRHPQMKRCEPKHAARRAETHSLLPWAYSGRALPPYAQTCLMLAPSPLPFPLRPRPRKTHSISH